MLNSSLPGPALARGASQEVIEAWNYIAEKLVEMAENFPEDKYGYRPTPEVRSFAEHLLHVAEANYILISAAQGTKLEKFSPEMYKTKAETLEVLKTSFADGAAVIEQAGDAGMRQLVQHPVVDLMVSQNNLWMIWIEHAGEHYGSLVLYYRLNNLVPPASGRLR